MSVLVAYGVGKLIMHGLNKANTVDSTVTAERLQQNNLIFRDQIGLGKDFKFDQHPFDAFLAARKKNIDEPATTFATAIKDEKLKAALDKPDIKKMVQDALSNQHPHVGIVAADKPLEGMLDTAQKNFTSNTRHFAELSKQIPPLKVEAVIQTMSDIVSEGVRDIELQQKLETENLKALFKPIPHPTDPTQPPTDSPLVTKLKAEGVTDLAAAEKAMLEDLSTAHKAQMKTFQDETSAAKVKLHQAARNDFAEVNFIASLSADNKKMREVIRLAAAANRDKEIKPIQEEIQAKEEEARKLGLPAPNSPEDQRKKELIQEILDAKAKIKQIEDKFGNLSVGLLNAKDADPNVGHVNLADLPEILSKTGKTIKQKKPGEFTLEIGAMLNPFGSPVGYFLGNKVQHDMNLLAEAVRASGKSSIQMNVNYSNEAMAMKRAEQAYHACINAGYPPEKIKINVTVKGEKKDFDPEKVFGKEKIAEFKAKAEKITAERDDKFKLTTTGQETKPVKDALEQLKSKYEAEQAEQQRIAEEKAKAAELAAENDEEEEHHADLGAHT
ncbi:hypothetical protein [Legionella sp. km772]|uniref:hypothetical protein n=1 Tax=Legionella sp. km772 TaxID=2498111 RepID=UPI000F8C7022|nr:hypothetical protein [Legionella sp. km772]RUR12683.1 hypothetical protein ELY15_04445 [Legionella sp. km772]